MNDIPSATSANFAERVRETIQIMMGKRGDSLDRVVTLRDLVASGFASVRGSVTGASPIPLSPGDALTAEPDLTPPPTPTNLAATAAISNIIITHDAPQYSVGSGHDRTVVYGVIMNAGAPLPTFDQTVQLTDFSGSVASYATNPGTTYRLWAKWRSIDGVLSTYPAGGINGVEVTTGSDVSAMVEAMTGPGNPFTVLSAATTIGGVVFPAGVYSTNAFIQDLQVTNAKIANLAIDDAKIASLSAAKITTGTLDADRIAANTITGSKIVALSIAGDRMTAGTITGDKIAANAITAGLINAGTITGDKIAGNTITAGNIQAGSISGDKIAGNTITGTNIAGNTITGSQIKTNTITAGNIQFGTIVGDNIATGAITATKIEAGAVTATKIEAGSITGAKIAGATLTGDHIVGGSISGTKIAAGTIAGDRIVAGDITGIQIKALAIEASHLAAGSVTASKVSFDSGINGGSLRFGTGSSSQYTVLEVDTVSSAHWAIHANGGPSYLQSLVVGAITSGSLSIGSVPVYPYRLTRGSYMLDLQSDRNLVLSSSGTAVWSTGTAVSDRRLKVGIEPTRISGLEIVGKLEVVDFQWAPDSVLADGGRTHTGLIAQDVGNLIPDAVALHGTNYLLHKEELVPVLLKAVQELRVEMAALRPGSTAPV